MTNVQVAMLASAAVISSAIVGFAITQSKREPTPKERVGKAVEFVEAVAQNFHAVSETVKAEIVRDSIVSLQRSIELYAHDHGDRFPATLDDLASGTKHYVPANDPDLWGRAYHYSVGASTRDSRPYDLHSLGPDGRDGTSDDIYAEKPRPAL